MLVGNLDDPATIYISMTDAEHPLSSYSDYAFNLDDFRWPTVEHYFQAMKFRDAGLREKIRATDNAADARRTARRHFWRIRFDWKRLRETVMTRAVYIKCMTYPDVAKTLLETGNQPIVELSQYDYFWGRGRDGRGRNKYGKILMNVRERLVTQIHSQQ